MFLLTAIYAQPSIDYWDHARYFKISGGTVSPGDDFSNTSEDGLFAEDGYQFGIDYNYMIAMGLGIGFNFEFNRFNFNESAFMEYAMPEKMEIGRGYGSGKFGLNALFNIPVILVPETFVFNLYIEGNAGFRGMSIPYIDLEYNELINNYVEVSYRPRSSAMEYLGYSAGAQFIFNDKFGINVSYSEVLPRKHTVKYSVRKFDAEGRLFEEESYVSNYLDSSGLQFGIMFLFGK